MFNPVFLGLGGSILAAIWVIQGSQGTPTGHLGVQTWFFTDFRWIWGPSGDNLFDNFGDLFVIWGIQVAIQVPGQVFLGFGTGNRPGIRGLDVLKP